MKAGIGLAICAVVILAGVLCAQGALAAKAKCGEDEVSISLSELPEAVRATVEREVGNGKIEELEKETENGQTVYEVEFVRDGKSFEMEIAPDGKVIEVEEEGADDGDKTD